MAIGIITISETMIKEIVQNEDYKSSRKGLIKALITFAIADKHADLVWALEKNNRAIAFYKLNGFHLTSIKKYEEDTTEYLVELKR